MTSFDLNRHIAHRQLAHALGAEQQAYFLLRKHKPAGAKAAMVTPLLNKIKAEVKGAHMAVCSAELGDG